ncbi:hypothetical protein [Umezawaea beigongshangensis]|uniref:hypothetical protein n=1 Tax=Umezawaea beigongshangensis TaxID=2780383 RepID=UPI0018F122E3|nr:hypothetical protein [Umezawaea beigongshangensis]
MRPHAGGVPVLIHCGHGLAPGAHTGPAVFAGAPRCDAAGGRAALGSDFPAVPRACAEQVRAITG